MSKNLLNTVVSAVKNFVSGGVDEAAKNDAYNNSEYLKYMYDEWEKPNLFDERYTRTFTIPAMTAGERKVLSVNLGKLTRSDYVAYFPLLHASSFNSTTFTIRKIGNELFEPNLPHTQSFSFAERFAFFGLTKTPAFPANLRLNNSDDEVDKMSYADSISSIGKDYEPSLNYYLAGSLCVTYDYRKCCRPRIDAERIIYIKPYEQIDQTANQNLLFDGVGTNYINYDEYVKKPFTYENLGKGAIIGWYSYGGAIGVFQTDKKIFMESSWLELQADGTTELKIALKNVDATTSTEKPIKIFFYNI